MPQHDCLICSMEDTEPSSRIFIDDLWAAEVAPGYEVPGWFFLRARRHAEKLTGLDDAEVATLGRHAQDLVAAVERATGAPAVYFLSFGESYRHFHALVAARPEDVPPTSRGGALVSHMLPEGQDAETALAVASEVRAAYADIVDSRDRAQVG